MSVTVTFRYTHNYADQKQNGITVPVQLSVGTQAVRLPAKLDTGASYCIFQREYGEILGLNIEAGQQTTFATANSSFVAYGHEVMIACFEWQFNSTVFFPREREIRRNVLGRNGWIQNFRMQSLTTILSSTLATTIKPEALLKSARNYSTRGSLLPPDILEHRAGVAVHGK